MRGNVRSIVSGSILLALVSACGGSSKSDGNTVQNAGAQNLGAGAGGVGGFGVGTGGAPSAGAGGAPTTSGGGSSIAGSGAYPPVDIGPQTQSNQLDVLFVVDNSSSMAGKQAVLAASVPAFVAQLAKSTKDIHFGVISTSLGGHGGTVCAEGTGNVDDKAQLVPSKRTGLPTYQDSGFLAYDSSGKAGEAVLDTVSSGLQAIIKGTGETGCGFEAPLEAMYRFLVDPEPPLSVKLVQQQSTRTDINDIVLTQRKAFLRPDSAVAIVILSDENDCSILDEGVGWFVGASARMPLATSACKVDPNDKCCRSCAQRETSPPAGCPAVMDDSTCKTVPPGQSYATWDSAHDNLNLRCFHQRQRFGFDLLYPVERYSNALSAPRVQNRAGQLVDNPLLAARDGKGPRSATLISVSVIVGAPWQDLATTATLKAPTQLEYMDSKALESNGRWPMLVGAVENAVPSDPFMIESTDDRMGQNPVSQAAISPSNSQNPLENPINGHEQHTGDSDLQYACTFALPAPIECMKGAYGCECAPDTTGELTTVIAANSPACQPPAGGPPGATQYYGKGYPGTRELRFAHAMGTRAGVASICPKSTTAADANASSYYYKAALDALASRIAITLQ